MSKPHIDTTDLPEAAVKHAYEKAKNRQRRHDTRKIKKQRMTKARWGKYLYTYCIIDEKPVYEHYLKEYPEHLEKRYVWDTRYIRHYDYETGEYYDTTERYLKFAGYNVVPTRIIRRRRYLGVESITPYLKRYHFPKKHHKQQSSRKLRRQKDIFQRGKYKKLYDLKWEIT